MKLETHLSDATGKQCLSVAWGENLNAAISNDAVAAHALMQAQDEFWKQDDLDSLDARDAVEMIGVRADELMREWGFDSGEDA